VAALPRTVAFLEKQEQRRVASSPVPQEVKGVRFSARSVRAQRARLGLSAKDFGGLVGVSALTIYSWESGKSRPRARQLACLAAPEAASFGLAIRFASFNLPARLAAFDPFGLPPFLPCQ